MLPRHSVAIQLKTFTPVGMATRYDATMKNPLSASPSPTVNMWCAQTIIEMNAMPRLEKATAAYPKIGLRANTGRISEMIPNAGRMRMYTSGCPKNQKRCW